MMGGGGGEGGGGGGGGRELLGLFNSFGSKLTVQ